jgi:hypothetical protein
MDGKGILDRDVLDNAFGSNWCGPCISLKSKFHSVDIGINTRDVVMGVLGRNCHGNEEFDACSVVLGVRRRSRQGSCGDEAEVIKQNGQHIARRYETGLEKVRNSNDVVYEVESITRI